MKKTLSSNNFKEKLNNFKEKFIKPLKFNIEEYCIILDFNENKRIYAKIQKDKQSPHYNSVINPSEILKHKKN